MQLSLTATAIETILAPVEAGATKENAAAALTALQAMRTDENKVPVDAAITHVEGIIRDLDRETTPDEPSSSEPYYEPSSSSY